ncbi:hypothetical protein [Paenibacillus piri]|uniref:Tyrosine protein kinase n=1 Tax=Paenibacillus piri TaxID=2547395 RepID=A0A4R5KUL0_9BACL|nr:hypothetical protein [Paenibacillus piri]TDF99202.1 hypothetical protein E1757_04885 [Paenibacillus piri]
MDNKFKKQTRPASVHSIKAGSSDNAAKTRRKHTPQTKAVKPNKYSAYKPSRRYAEDRQEMRPRTSADGPGDGPATGQINALPSLFESMDGIISMMTKANQMFKLVQQMSPFFKLFGLFGGGKAATASIADSSKSGMARISKSRRPSAGSPRATAAVKSKR